MEFSSVNLLKICVFLVSASFVLYTLLSAVRTLVLPRGVRDPIVGLVFDLSRRCFDLRLRWTHTFADRDRIMALYAPISLLALVPAWLICILIGYTGLYWATGDFAWNEDFVLSGSSLFTLGFSSADGPVHMLLIFSEATIGLILVALVIAYLPTIYAAFSRRETAVTLLEVRAGTPPSALEMILRLHRIGRLHDMDDFWALWEVWFAEVDESHTSLPALVFFRSPRPDHSWVNAAGAVLDAGALLASCVDLERKPQAELCMRAGYLALRHIAEYFGVVIKARVYFPQEPISIKKEDFDIAYARMAANGVPLKGDREQAWQDFGGWRVNYDKALSALCAMTMAPPAPWASGGMLEFAVPSLLGKTQKNEEQATE